MTHPLSKSHRYHTKGFLDQSTSQTSSTLTYRITRKQDEGSASRRSSRSSADRSLDAIDISKFYVKMNTKEEKTTDSQRPTILKRTSQVERIKRRSPTPAQSKKLKEDPAKKDEQGQLENEIMIAELQRKCGEEKKGREMLEKRVAAFERELKAKLKKIEQLERKNNQLVQNEQISSKKLQQFQEITSINENNLNEARNNLEKLRNIIKKNRCSQLEIENAKFKKQNSDLKQELNRINADHAKQQEVMAHLEEDLLIMQRENENLKRGAQLKEKNIEIQKLKQAIVASKSQKEQELEKLILIKNQSEMKLRLRAEKLQIQIAYLNRKKNEEIEQLKMKHLQLVGKMRTKLCTMREQYSDLKEEYDKLRNKGSVQIRRSLLLTDHRPNTDDLFLFDLSP